MLNGQNENINPKELVSVASKEMMSMDDIFLRTLDKIINDNLRNEQFSVEDLANEVAYSRSQLHRKLHKLTGQSISQYIRKIRLDHSIEMLKNNVGTVSEIAFKVGFGSSTYFIKCFTEAYGYSPGEVRKKSIEGEAVHQTQSIADQLEQTNSTEPTPPKPGISPLEALHPASSEQLILEIFKEVAVHKTALQKFLIVDEEEGESLDARLLAYQLIKTYPWPIGVELRRLFSASLRHSGKERFDQLNKAITRTLKLTAFIALSESVHLISRDPSYLHHETLQRMYQTLSNLTAESLIATLKYLCVDFEKCPDLLIIQELPSALDKAFFRELDDWTGIRPPSDESEYFEECANLEQTLMLLLKKTSFMARYKLVNVGAIKVNKRRNHAAAFEHHFHMLNSTDAEFKIHEEMLENFSDSHAVLMMKSVKNIEDFLNLSPFIVDTHQESTKENASPIKRDIYLLDRFDGTKLQYSGTGATTTDDLSSLDNYHLLVEEFADILKALNQ